MKDACNVLQSRELVAHARIGAGIGDPEVKPLELEPGFIARRGLRENARHADRARLGESLETVGFRVEAPAFGERNTFPEGTEGTHPFIFANRRSTFTNMKGCVPFGAGQCPASRSAWRRSAGPN